MRARLLFVGFAVSLVAAAIVVEACGGDTGNDTTGADAGQDTGKPDTGPADTGPADTGADTGPPCDTTTDFTTKIADASIADGASSTGLCIGCAKDHCSKEIATCNNDCSCNGFAAKGISCFAASGGDILKTASCVGSLPKDTKALLGVFGCIQTSCSDECALGDFLDGGDGGM